MTNLENSMRLFKEGLELRIEILAKKFGTNSLRNEEISEHEALSYVVQRLSDILEVHGGK